MLRTYSLGRDVQYEDVTETRALLSLVGPRRARAARRRAARGGALVRHGRARHLRGAPLLGVDVICEPGTTLDVEPVSEEVAECVRIEAGRPRLGFDMDADTMPQEAGINERAVSFTKGCYVGQETVARLHYRGKPNRHLRGLRLVGAGRARRRDHARRAGWSGGSAPRASPPGSARSRSRSCAARRAPGDDGRRRRRAGRGRASYRSSIAEPRRPASRHGLSPDSPLLGHGPQGAEGYDHQTGVLDLPAPPRARSSRSTCATCASSCPSAEPGREIDDWGRSQRIFDLVEPLLDFYYRYWFRVEVRGRRERAVRRRRADRLEPLRRAAAGRADDHAGDPPRAPASRARSTCSARTGSRATRASGCSPTRSGSWRAHPANAQRLLRDEGRLVLVFPEGQKGSRKLFWQRYRLRRFGRGGFVRTAMRAGVPIVPDRGDRRRGGDADLRPRAAAPAAHRAHLLPDQPRLPAVRPRGRARCTCPRSSGSASSSRSTCRGYSPEDADDIALVGRLSERIRLRIQEELDDLLLARKSVWFG